MLLECLERVSTDVLKCFWPRLWLAVGINSECCESKMMKAAVLHEKENFLEPPFKRYFIKKTTFMVLRKLYL